MNIKLNAKLTAYSKIDSLENCNHNLIYVTEEAIDTLFDTQQVNNPDMSTTEGFVSMSDIDSLFGGH